MTNKDYVNEYYRTIANLNNDLEKRARKAIIEFGKAIDILAIYAHDLNLDREDEDVLNVACGECEWGYVKINGDDNINCAILGVRYNKDIPIIEAFMKDDEDIINEWVNIDDLDVDTRRAVYITILEYVDIAKYGISLSIF